MNERVFSITDRDYPLDDAAVFWINVPLTWVLFPIAALLVADAPWLAAGCFTIAIVKAWLVVAYYMHLKYDAKVFRALFIGPLMIAVLTIIALLFLFGHIAVRLPTG